MFQKYYFYYRIFHANKLISRTYSIWQNSPNIFGNQFSYIQNRNGHCNIRINSQQLCQCQRNQFCSGNDEGMQFFLPSESANSSLITISSTETTTNNETEQKEQPQFSGVLETRLLELGNGRQLRLKFEKGESGQKLFRIKINRFAQFFYFRNILIPEDAYSFVHALDELMGELATKNFVQKMQTQDPQSMITETGNDGQPQNILKLKTVEMTGQNHKFQFELLLFPNENQPNGQKSICLRLISFSETTKQKRFTILSLLALPWLRKQMAEMLTKYDGTEEIVMEAPAQIPKQFFKRSISNYKNPTNNDHFLALETRLLEFGNHYHKKQLRLKLEKGTSGQKFFAITLLTNATGQYKHLDFRNIPIPHDGYAFVRAFDELIGELAAENFEQKYQIQDILKLTEEANNADDDQFRYKFELRSVEVIGRHHKFHVELVLFSNVHKPNGQICLLLNSFNEKTKRKGTLNLPLRALPWLRNQMAEMLAKYDGTEEIGKEALAKIPQKFLINAMSANITNKDSTEQLDPTMAKMEERIRALFDFDDEDMENYKRIAAKIKYTFRDID